jgi:sRNA-binding regulator protein Hfq
MSSAEAEEATASVAKIGRKLAKGFVEGMPKFRALMESIREAAVYKNAVDVLEVVQRIE